MPLSGTFEGIEGDGAGGVWIGDKTERFGATRLNKARASLRMTAAGVFVRSQFIGGSKTRGLRADAAIDAIDAIEFEIENASNYVGSTTGIAIPILVLVRVEHAGLTVTPRIYNVTAGAVASISGAAGCSATAEDYSGTNQRQELLLTLATGTVRYKLQFVPTTKAYEFWGIGWRSLYR